MKQDMIVILDLGSTQNTVVARQIRDMGVYSEIHPHDITPEELGKLDNVKGIILNGGENRVVDGEEVVVMDALYDLGIPMISIDYPQSKCEKQFAVLPTDEEMKAFVFDTCKSEANWNMKNFIADQVEIVRRQVGDKKVTCFIRWCRLFRSGCTFNQSYWQTAYMGACKSWPDA